MRLPISLPCLFVVAPLLAGCGVFGSPRATRGNPVDQDALAQLVPGTATRADAMSLLGSPTARAAFNDNTWIYIGQVTRQRVGRTPGVAEQKVVVLNFDQDGRLRSIREANIDDAKPVDMAGGATPSPGSEASILQQIFGNVGRFSPLGSGSVGPSTGGGMR